MNRIFMVDKSEVHYYPPVLSNLLILKRLNYDVVFLTSRIQPNTKELLLSKGVNCVELLPKESKIPVLRYFSYLKFGFAVVRYLKNNNVSRQGSLLWIVGAYTSMSFLFFKKFLTGCLYIMQIHELHETVKASVFRFAIRNIIHHAKIVFMPEYNRTILYQCKFNLRKRPVVLPNKPYFIPSVEEIEYLSHNYKEQLSLLSGKRVILYQGYIHAERDLTNYVKAVKQLGSAYCLLLVGRDVSRMVGKYREILPDLIHIDFMPAPDYLVFTKNAHIGVVTYDQLKLNTAYCAPNKIYEYGAFGLPILGNDIPGLKYPLISHHAGCVADDNEVDSIVAAINIIEDNYERFRMGAKQLFDSVDNIETIKVNLAKVEENLV